MEYYSIIIVWLYIINTERRSDRDDCDRVRPRGGVEPSSSARIFRYLFFFFSTILRRFRTEDIYSRFKEFDLAQATLLDAQYLVIFSPGRVSNP